MSQSPKDLDECREGQSPAACCEVFDWLEAIVQLISENRCEATYDEIINEMIANAWYSVLEFHIHLSGSTWTAAPEG